jgi:hypothetical protein
MSDWMEDPLSQKWARDVIDDLVPMIDGSAVTISLVPKGDPDVKFAVELGISIMLDKPIVLVVAPGQKLPAHLMRVSDGLVEWSKDPVEMQRRIKAALQEHIDLR